MRENYLLISGRTGAGKTELLMAYVNLHPEGTLIISEEYSDETIKKRGLNPLVKVISAKGFDTINIQNYTTVCIDYVEIFEKEFIESLLEQIMDTDTQIVAVTQMKKTDYSIMNNIFEKYNKGR